MKQAVLLALPAICGLLFLVPRPMTALRNYLLLLPFLPEFLVMRVGIAITGSRIASLMFLAALCVRAGHKLQPRFDRMDALFAAFLGFYLLAVIPGPPVGGPVFAAGFLVDIALPYYFFRCLVRTTEDLHALITGLMRPLPIILVFAAMQSVTGFGLFDMFKGGDDVFGVYDSGMKRLGLTRADVGLTHYIMMGLFFAMHVPIAIGHYLGRGLDFAKVAARVIFIPLGAFFSLSGGSFLITGAGIGSWAMWPVRKVWPVIAFVGICGVVFVEMNSNRGTLAILATFAATDGDSAWYRIRLPSAVFAKMDGHWLLGYGRNKPEMGIYNDITNHYLWWLMQGGLPCMLSFIGCIAVALHRAGHAARRSCSEYLYWVSWGIGIAIVGLALGMMTVTLFGQMRTYLFLLFAMAACTASAARHERKQMRDLQVYFELQRMAAANTRVAGEGA